MQLEQWERLQSLFHEALQLPREQRRAFVESACGDDRELAAELLVMLEEDGNHSSLLDRGLSGVAFQMLDSSMATFPPEEFGSYRLKKILGEGGMGVVWLAERKDAGNLVAIKFLPHAAFSPARRERFTREIKTLAKLKHAYIARLYDAGTAPDGIPWFAMEYVQGLPVTDYCREHALPVEERLRIFRCICEAVQYLHSQEVIHRDLKPSNILVEKDGTPRLLDFGIAKELHAAGESADLTKPGMRFMSRYYAAPEWIHDGSVGFSTDVYSLGIILYEMLAERLPIDTSKGTTLGMDVIDDTVPRQPPEPPSRAAVEAAQRNGRKAPGAPGKAEWRDLDVLCLKAMHRDSQQRYPSVEALLRDVDHYLKREPLEARPDSLRYRAGKFVARNRKAVYAASASLLLVLGLVTFYTVRLANARARADRESAIAVAMNRFLADDLLGRSDPFKSGQAKESFVDVVSQASPQIDSQFASEPLLAARLHATIAKAFDNRSDFARARQEYEQADRLFQQAEGPLSQEAIVLQLQWAAMEARSYEPGSLDRAKSLLGRAEQSTSRIPHPEDDLSVWVLSTRGVIGIISNDAHAANENLSAALQRAQAIPSFNPTALLQIKQFLAFTYIRMGDGAKAESALRDLIQQYSRAEGPDSPRGLKARVNLAQALLVEKKYAEAIDEANLVYPVLVAKLGEEHEVLLGILSTRAAAEGSLGRWNDAIRDDLSVHAIAVRKQGPVSFYSLSSLSDGALSQCRSGRFAEGETNARSAYEQSSKALGPRSGMTGGISYALAVCLIRRNKLDEAEELLRNIDAKAVSQLSGEPSVAASIALAQGEIALRRGDYLLAQRYAQTAAPAFETSDAGAGEKQAYQELSQALDAHLHARK